MKSQSGTQDTLQLSMWRIRLTGSFWLLFSLKSWRNCLTPPLNPEKMHRCLHAGTKITGYGNISNIGPFAEINHRKFVRGPQSLVSRSDVGGPRSFEGGRAKGSCQTATGSALWLSLVRAPHKFTMHTKYSHNTYQIHLKYIQYIWCILNTDTVPPDLANTSWIYRPDVLDVFWCIWC